MKILNLTQHPSSPEQREAGVYDLPAQETSWAEDTASSMRNWLTFPHPNDQIRALDEPEIPDRLTLQTRADILAEIAARTGHPDDPEGRPDAAMIGGAPYLMPVLEKELRERGITPLYAFSERQSVEEALPDGSVRKTQVFRHLGFVEGAL